MILGYLGEDWSGSGTEVGLVMRKLTREELTGEFVLQKTFTFLDSAMTAASPVNYFGQ